MLVKVTQEHIDKGRQNCQRKVFKSKYCPVALALRDTFKVNFARVTYEKLIIGIFPEDNLIFEIPTPSEVHDWISRFDNNDVEIEPLEFELSLEGVKL